METTPKDRIIKNVITSVIGTLFMLLAISLIYINIKSLTFPTIGLASALGLLGWAFLMAKDTLLEGMFFGIFKVVKKDDANPS